MTRISIFQATGLCACSLFSFQRKRTWNSSLFPRYWEQATLAVVSVVDHVIHLIVLKQLNYTQSWGLFTPTITWTISITSEMDCLVCGHNNYFFFNHYQENLTNRWVLPYVNFVVFYRPQTKLWEGNVFTVVFVHVWCSSLLQRPSPDKDSPPSHRASNGGHCSWRYASYWNMHLCLSSYMQIRELSLKKINFNENYSCNIGRI